MRQEHRAGEKLVFRRLPGQTGVGEIRPHTTGEIHPMQVFVRCASVPLSYKRFRRSHAGSAETARLDGLPRPLLRLPRRGAGDRGADKRCAAR